MLAIRDFLVKTYSHLTYSHSQTSPLKTQEQQVEHNNEGQMKNTRKINFWITYLSHEQQKIDNLKLCEVHQNPSRLWPTNSLWSLVHLSTIRHKSEGNPLMHSTDTLMLRTLEKLKHFHLIAICNVVKKTNQGFL